MLFSHLGSWKGLILMLISAAVTDALGLVAGDTSELSWELTWEGLTTGQRGPGRDTEGQDLFSMC